MEGDPFFNLENWRGFQIIGHHPVNAHAGFQRRRKITGSGAASDLVTKQKKQPANEKKKKKVSAA